MATAEAKSGPKGRPARRAAGHDRHMRHIVTPEGVTVLVRLGDRGGRLGAFLLDLILIFVLLHLSVLVFWGMALALGDLDLEFGDLLGAMFFLVLFLLLNFYYLVFELHWQGRTPGKRALGLRVADRRGRRLGVDQIITRNLTRQVEWFVPLVAVSTAAASGWPGVLLAIWALIMAMMPLFNRDALRIGDMVAGTWVIETPKAVLLPDLADQAAARVADPALAGGGFTDAQLAIYGVYELQVLEDILRRPASATKTATVQEVADRIRQKIGWSEPGAPGNPHGTDLDFLSAFYAAQRRRLEQGLLFGRAKVDKFGGRPDRHGPA